MIDSCHSEPSKSTQRLHSWSVFPSLASIVFREKNIKCQSWTSITRSSFPPRPASTFAKIVVLPCHKFFSETELDYLLFFRISPPWKRNGVCCTCRKDWRYSLKCKFFELIKNCPLKTGKGVLLSSPNQKQSPRTLKCYEKLYASNCLSYHNVILLLLLFASAKRGVVQLVSSFLYRKLWRLNNRIVLSAKQ